MSVIGRLDKQVEEVLISPHGSNRRQTEATRNVPSREDAAREEQTEPATRADENLDPVREQAELPVWLL